MGCLTQDAPQEPPVDQTRVSAANNGPTQKLNALYNQASQRKTSLIESCKMLANSAGSQLLTSNYGGQASDDSFTAALTLRANDPIQILNIGTIVQDTLNSISARLPPIRELSLPFDLAPCPQQKFGISGDHIQNNQANNSFTHPEFPCPMVSPLTKGH